MSDESHHWIRPRRRPPRRTGPSTVNGRTAKELLAEQTEAIRNMSLEELEELEELVAAAAAGARASRAEDEAAAAWRRAQRYRAN